MAKRNKEYAYVDVHVGDRIRVRRTLMGMGQVNLGEVLGLSFQQVQKYEKGANRVSASRLIQFAKILNVPASYFFDNVPVDAAAHAHRLSDDDSLSASPGNAVPPRDHGDLDLVSPCATAWLMRGPVL